MSNVYSDASFAVLSIMDTTLVSSDNTYIGSTVFIQQKPESDHGNITTVSFQQSDFEKADFNVQARFEANVVPAISNKLSTIKTHVINIVNSNISVNSYSVDGKLNP